MLVLIQLDNHYVVIRKIKGVKKDGNHAWHSTEP